MNPTTPVIPNITAAEPPLNPKQAMMMKRMDKIQISFPFAFLSISFSSSFVLLIFITSSYFFENQHSMCMGFDICTSLNLNFKTSLRSQLCKP